MKDNLFPNNVIQILGLFIVSLLLATSVFIFIDIHSFLLSEFNKTIFFLFFCSIFIGIACLVNYRRKQKTEWNFNVVNFRYWYLMLSILFVFNVGINSPVNHFFSDKIGLQNPFSNPFFVVGAVLIGPILEEIIFRGIILKGLLTKYNPKFSIIFSALIFGMVHGEPIQIWGSLLIGLLLGWIYCKTKSIGTTILLHSFVNLTSLTHDYFISNFIDSTTVKSIDKVIIFISIPLLFLVTRQLILNMKNYKVEII